MADHSLGKYLDEESGLAEYARKAAQNSIKELKCQSARLLDLYVAGKISDSVYQSKNAEIEAQTKEAQRQVDENIVMNDDMKAAMEKAVELMCNVSEMVNQADQGQKNEILRLLLENCVMSGKKLHYKIRKPFDVLLSNPKDMSWLNVHPDDFSKYQGFANQMKTLTI